jgi:hypothetical protein
MPLPTLDEDYLNTKGFRWEFLPEAPQQLLVLRDVRLADGKFDHDVADILIRIPPGFPMALLDMYWVAPVVRLRGGALPVNADQYETHEGRTWQRFSRHLPGGRWRPGVDSLKTYLPLVLGELCQP